MKREAMQERFATRGCEQIFVSLVVILLGRGLCLIPFILGWGVTANIGGNRGPGGAAALIVGSLLMIYGLVGLCLGVLKGLRGKF